VTIHQSCHIVLFISGVSAEDFVLSKNQRSPALLKVGFSVPYPHRSYLP
jgi:hypothetical protein